jgi:hypothetical protein
VKVSEHFSKLHAEKHAIPLEDSPLTAFAEVFDKDELFLMSATPEQLDAFPAARLGSFASALEASVDGTTGTKSGVLGVLLAYNIHCIWVGYEPKDRREPLPTEKCVNYQLRHALPGVPFLGQDSGGEQGISQDATGHYQLMASHSGMMLTSLLFVREQVPGQ